MTSDPSSDRIGPSTQPEEVPPALHPSRDTFAAQLRQLVDRLAGDVVLRHIVGQRTVDLGQGSPPVAQWVAERAASLVVLPREALEILPGSSLPLPDQSFEVAYCLRTFPHLGQDGLSSRRAARVLLVEIARILTPGGTALVQIENPRSLVGLYSGIRHPMTLVGTEAAAIHQDHGLVRFDTLGQLLRMLPLDLQMVDLHGLRVLLPLPHLLGVPFLGRVLARSEWWLRDLALIRHFGAQLLLVLKKLRPAPDPE